MKEIVDMSIMYKPEPLGFIRGIKTITATMILLAIPFIGWMALAALNSRPVRDVEGISCPIGAIYKRCPKCGHIFGDTEHKLDKYHEWVNYVCVKCGEHSRVLNYFLLGVYSHAKWTGDYGEKQDG